MRKLLYIIPLIITTLFVTLLPGTALADVGDYYKVITITGTADGIQTNYQMKLLVGQSSGATGEDVDCNSHIGNDFGGLRFTKGDGTTEIDYWIESITGSNPNRLATVWVEVPSIPASPSTVDIYMYYSTTGTTTSSGANTFIVFDDMERGSDGDTIGGNWTESVAHVHISTEQDIGNDAGYFGTRSAKFVGYSSTRPVATLPVSNSNNIAIMFRLYKEDSADLLWGHGDGTNLCQLRFEADEDISLYDGASYVDTGATNLTADAWQLIELNNFVWASQTVDIWLNGTKIKDNGDFSYASSSANDVIYPRGDLYTDRDGWLDNVIVRNYTTTAPTFTNYGAETATSAAPTVTTQAASSVEDNTATGNGNITDTGGTNATIRGVEWDTNSGAPYANDVHEHGDYGTGAFTISITGLPTGTTIYYRAYATNPDGTGYGAEKTFLTKPAAATNVSATDGTEYTKVVVTWTKSTGASGYKVYEGANLLDTLGDVATYDDTTAPAGTITAGTASASDGTSTTQVVLSLAGESVSNGASRTYKVRAFNATGDADDSATDNGYRGHGTLTYQWMMSATGVDTNYSNVAGATTDPYNDIAAPKPTSFDFGTILASDGLSTSFVRLSTGNVPPFHTAYPHGRYWKCTLSATGVTSANSTANFGYISWGTVTYQWYRSAGDSDGSYSPVVGGTTNLYDDTGAPAATITGGATSASDGTSTTQVTLSLVGASANNGAGRYYKLQCTAASHGISENSTANRGYRGVGALTYQWRRSADIADGAYSNIVGATADTYNDTTTPAATITAGVASASDGTSETEITLSIAGESANNGALRWYYCTLTATGAANADSTHDSGYRGVGALTYQWQRSAGDSNAAYGNIAGATTDPYSDTTIVTFPEGRYYQCLLTATGAANVTTNADRGYFMEHIAAVASGVDAVMWGGGLLVVGVMVLLIFRRRGVRRI